MRESTESDLKRLRKILSRRLGGISDLLEASATCRSVAASDVEGAASFLLFALYFESLVAEREGNSVDAEEYEQLVTEVVPAVLDCLGCIENFDVVKLLASLDSFARIALRHAL